MEFEYFTEESVSGDQKEQHYLLSRAENIVIQATTDGFCLRTELWLRSYLDTMLAGNALPGFAHHGKVDVDEATIRPMIDGLSYKAYMEQKLSRINKALSMQGRIVMSSMPLQGKDRA